MWNNTTWNEFSQLLFEHIFISPLHLMDIFAEQRFLGLQGFCLLCLLFSFHHFNISLYQILLCIFLIKISYNPSSYSSPLCPLSFLKIFFSSFVLNNLNIAWVGVCEREREFYSAYSSISSWPVIWCSHYFMKFLALVFSNMALLFPISYYRISIILILDHLILPHNSRIISSMFLLFILPTVTSIA